MLSADGAGSFELSLSKPGTGFRMGMQSLIFIGEQIDLSGERFVDFSPLVSHWST